MPSPRLTPRTAALLVAACTVVAYLNSLNGRFVMDDRGEIVGNPSIHSLLPPWPAMFVGNEFPARPLPYLTFAIDYSLWGPEPWGYHVTNLVIHVTAALALFAVARLTLSSPRFAGPTGDRATALAACIATIWAVHPLCTQAVTYVYQRIESMAGMWCLLSLAAFAQAAATGWGRQWLAGCVLAAAAAMASKENAVVLPLVILAYDWLVVAEPHGLRRRWRFHATLCATWMVLGLHLVGQLGRFQEFQDVSHPPLAYALTQPRVILHYIRLALWPVGLCFDLPWPIAQTWREISPSLVYVSLLLGIVAVGVARRRSWSWLGLAFFLALAPTSSILPVAALAAEHRMYLPLAALVAAVVLGLHAIVTRRFEAGSARTRADRIAAGAAAIVVGILILLTQARNELYATPGGVWLDAIRRHPVNTRALWNLSAACEEIGEFDAAIGYADRIAEINIDMPAYEEMARRRLESGDAVTAERVLRHAIEKRTELAGADGDVTQATITSLAELLTRQGRLAEAAEVRRRLAGHQPQPPTGDALDTSQERIPPRDR